MGSLTVDEADCGWCRSIQFSQRVSGANSGDET